MDPNKGLGSSFFLLKLLEDGKIDWSKKYNRNNSLGFDVLISNNNLFCYFISNKIELLKTDNSGNILWSKGYGNKLPDHRIITPRMQQLLDGSFIIPSGSYYLIKADSLGQAASCIFSDSPTSDTTLLTSNILSFTKIDGGKDTSTLLISRKMPVLTQSRCVTRFIGIINADLLNTVQISPNPSSGIFKLSEANSQTYKIAIYDVYSNCIYNGIIKSNEDQIDLINKASGIYFYKIESPNGITFTGKLVIEK